MVARQAGMRAGVLYVDHLIYIIFILLVPYMYTAHIRTKLIIQQAQICLIYIRCVLYRAVLYEQYTSVHHRWQWHYQFTILNVGMRIYG